MEAADQGERAHGDELLRWAPLQGKKKLCMKVEMVERQVVVDVRGVKSRGGVFWHVEANRFCDHYASKRSFGMGWAL